MAPWAGALAGKFADYGISDDFIKSVEQQMQPGTSALFLLVRQVTLDKVLDALRPLDPEVLQTSLTAEQEQNLREAFGADASAGGTQPVAPPAVAAA